MKKERKWIYLLVPGDLKFKKTTYVRIISDWIINESVKTEGCNESGRMDVFVVAVVVMYGMICKC